MNPRRWISGIALVLLGAAAAVFILADRAHNSRWKREAKERARLVAAFHRVRPTVTPQSTRTLPVKGFRHFQCKGIKPIPAAKIRPGAPLEEMLAYPWPEKYVVKFHQPFNPIVFALNGIALHCHGAGLTPAARTIYRDALFDRLEEWSVLEDGKRFLEYRFPYHPLDYDMPVPWHSGFAQGQALTGLVFLEKTVPSTRGRELLAQVAASFALPGNPRGTVFTDERGFYWIDEYPHPAQNHRSLVLNAHVWGLLGLYYLWSEGGISSHLAEFSAAVHSLAVHWPFYRYPGRTNCYDLRICERDYAPNRAGTQMRWLHAMTGDPAFATAASLFAEDVRVERAARLMEKECGRSPLHKSLCLIRRSREEL